MVGTLWAAVLVHFSLIDFAIAQSNAPAPLPPANLPPDAPPARLVTGLDRILSDVELVLALAVLAFGLLALILQSIMFWRRFASAEFVKLMTVTLVVTATLFLITAGFGNDQIAPAIGLFGTMLGYLLGRETWSPRDRSGAKPDERER